VREKAGDGLAFEGSVFVCIVEIGLVAGHDHGNVMFTSPGRKSYRNVLVLGWGSRSENFIYQGSAMLTKIMGRHTLTAEYDYTRLRIFHDSVFSSFNYDNVPTADPQNVIHPRRAILIEAVEAGAAQAAQLHHARHRQAPVRLHFFFDFPVDRGFPISACRIRCSSMCCKHPFKKSISSACWPTFRSNSAIPPSDQRGFPLPGNTLPGPCRNSRRQRCNTFGFVRPRPWSKKEMTREAAIAVRGGHRLIVTSRRLVRFVCLQKIS
jgi:hypothetical protein